MDVNNPDPFGVAAGARKLAIDIVLKALIEHASASDPAIKDRIVATAEAYLGVLPDSELEKDFVKRARAYIQSFVGPPTS